MLSLKRVIRYLKAQVKVFRVDRGFTVHSPFAYRFITRVLRERTPYYHFRKEVTEPWERLLYRVAVYFNPQRICCLGQEAERAREVLRLALPTVEFVGEEGAEFMFIGAGAEEVMASGVAGLETCSTVFALTPIEEKKFTLTFSDGHITVGLRRSGIPQQHYYVHFRQR